MRLIRETSNNKKVKGFLDAVPYVMATIRDVNKAAVENDIELLRAATEDPVPPCMLACKDKNGLTPLHKVKMSLKNSDLANEWILGGRTWSP